jgi:hypothetical protein
MTLKSGLSLLRKNETNRLIKTTQECNNNFRGDPHNTGKLP